MPLIRRTPEPARTPEDRADAPALASASRDERWAAARAAGDLPDSAESLGRALLTEQDVVVREAIFTSLVRIGTTASVDAVLPHLRSDDANLRTGALDALRAMPDATWPRLRSLLQDRDSDVRLLACDLVREVPGADASALLCELLETEPVANVCSVAVEVLAAVGGPDALPSLARCAERFRSDPFLAFSIKVAADRISAQTGGPLAGRQ